jgi:heme exporter protein A
MHGIDVRLLQAYLEARYEVRLGEHRLRLRVGQPAADRPGPFAGVADMVLLTAHNPGSVRLDDEENAQRTARLDARLAELGLEAWPSLHSAPDGTWPEHGRAVAIARIEQADRLAREFGQLAVVHLRAGEVRLRCFAAPPAGIRVDTVPVDFVPCAAAPADAMNEAPDDPQPCLLRARRLGFRRGEERIFGPLDIELAAGGVLVIEGGNGAGKTSLLRVLAGLLPPADDDEEGQEAQVHLGGSVALLGHSLGLTGELDALENLRFAAGLQGGSGGLSPTNALRGVGLEGYEDIPVGRLSAGQRKRVALARLLVAPAALWLLDEPYANLDPAGIALVNRLIERHNHAGGGVVLTSHGAQLPLRREAQRLRL